MARTSQRSSKNNNPTGKNQYSSSWGDTARERPFTTAAAAAAAVGAGVFLWSRRSQISDQISGLSEQLNEWRESITAERDSDGGFIARSNGSTSQSDIAEEAMTLKETGKKTKRPADPTIEEQSKVGAVAY